MIGVRNSKHPAPTITPLNKTLHQQDGMPLISDARATAIMRTEEQNGLQGFHDKQQGYQDPKLKRTKLLIATLCLTAAYINKKRRQLEKWNKKFFKRIAIMSNEEFDGPKEELMWEGRTVVILSMDTLTNEHTFLEAAMAYVFGNLIMTYKE
ncbi:PGR5-like protein 1B, chloroplastic [Tanacetum coccineum]